MLILLLFLICSGIIAGIALLVIGIVKLCHKNSQVREQKSNTAGVLFTVFGSLLTFISLIIAIVVISIGIAGM